MKITIEIHDNNDPAEVLRIMADKFDAGLNLDRGYVLGIINHIAKYWVRP